MLIYGERLIINHPIANVNHPIVNVNHPIVNVDYRIVNVNHRIILFPLIPQHFDLILFISS